MITTLNVLLFCLKVIEFFCVVSLLAIGIDLAWFTYDGWRREDSRVKAEEKAKAKLAEMTERAKARLRAKKEEEAWAGGFFQEHYVRGFDSNGAFVFRASKFPTATASEYFKEMDNLADSLIFENIEEL